MNRPVLARLVLGAAVLGAAAAGVLYVTEVNRERRAEADR
jgi:hypothetical protein